MDALKAAVSFISSPPLNVRPKGIGKVENRWETKMVILPLSLLPRIAAAATSDRAEYLTQK